MGPIPGDAPKKTEEPTPTPAAPAPAEAPAAAESAKDTPAEAPKQEEPAENLVQSNYEVQIKLANMQGDPDSPLYSVKNFEDLGLYVSQLLQDLDLTFWTCESLESNLTRLLQLQGTS